MQLSELETKYNQPIAMTCARDVVNELKDISEYHKEAFVVLHLNTKKKIISREIISIGILYACLIHPREVFRAAIINNAHSIILAHNHPSGDPTPSNEDQNVTLKIIEAGDILDIPLLDHVIVGKNTDEYYSFKEENEI